MRVEAGRPGDSVPHQQLDLVPLAASREDRCVRMPQLVPHAAGPTEAGCDVRWLEEELRRVPFQGSPVRGFVNTKSLD